jgi:hypothetical protein
LAVWNQ